MENTYQNPPAPMNTPVSAPQQPAGNKPAPVKPKSSPLKTVLAVLGLFVFFGIGLAGVLISQKQYISEGPVAPNVPESHPEAAIAQSSCTLTFNVPTPTPTPEPNECGYTPCSTDNDCKSDLVCVTADNGKKYCSVEAYKQACMDNPSTASCCQAPTPTPTPTPELLKCGEISCKDNFDCGNGLICITANNGNKYCAQSAYKTACEDNPSVSSCCQAPTVTPTPTPTPTITITGGQPDLPEELPVSGPADWLRYLQTGLAALGVGALFLLLL